MNEALFPYYERELLFIRQLIQEFAGKYPHIASRLLLEPNRSADSHTERLIQTFALMTGRVQQRLADDFPEISDAIFQMLYPHFVAPIPSMSIVEFEADPMKTQLTQGFSVPAGSRLTTRTAAGETCRYRTCYPVTLWPLQVREASFVGPPFPAGLEPPARAAALLTLRIECVGELKLAQLALDHLRLYLHGDVAVTAPLYETLFQHALQVLIRPTEQGSAAKPVVMSAATALRQVGFERGEGMVPYPPRAPLGYRLMTEYFTFPAKYFFADVGGWRRVARNGFQQGCEILIFCDRHHRALEQGVDRSTFRLGATPVVNLFEHDCEPLRLAAQADYRIIPSKDQPRSFEVYSIDAVFSHDMATNVRTDYPPFHSLRHNQPAGEETVYWYLDRRPAEMENDRGSEVFVHFVARDSAPSEPRADVIQVRATCMNRDLPMQLQAEGERLDFELEMAAPLNKIHCLRPVTTPWRPALARGEAWRLISHWNPNHLSLEDGETGLEAMREIIRLYRFTDEQSGQTPIAVLNQQVAEGLLAIAFRRVLGRVNDGLGTGLCQGIEVAIQLDEDKFRHSSTILFASVFEQFLGLYASLNSFTQLVVRTTKNATAYRHWPPRQGEGSLL
jgi:type VI secretion system protein ImpG